MLSLVGMLLAFVSMASASSAPTLDQLGSDIIPVRGSGVPCNVTDAACNSELYRNLPAISNFVGSVGTAQQVIRTHTPFVISSVSVPPLMACGGAGCGGLRVDGEVPELQTTQWRAYQAQRSSRPTASGVTVTSRLRMAFEQPAVLWEVDFNTSSTRPVNVSISWGASVAIDSQLGWTAALPEPVASGDAVTPGPSVCGVQTAMTARHAGEQVGSEAGVSLFALLATASPVWSFPPVDHHHLGRLEQQQCNVSGRWRFGDWPASQEMTFVEPFCDKLNRPTYCSKGHFTFESANSKTPWRTAAGTITGDAVSIRYNCSIGGCNVAGMINSACDTIDLGSNGRFTRGFHPSPPPPPAPLPGFGAGQAIANLSLDVSEAGTTLRAVAVFGRNISHARALLAQLVCAPSTFASSWSEAQERWENRWQNAFSPAGSADYSGSLPVLTVANKTEVVAPLERAYYMGVLTILLVQRNNLPMPGGTHSWPAQPRIYMTGMGNADGNIAIGVSQRWFWDSAQHSLTSSLLDPTMYMADAEQIIAYDLHCGNGVDLHSDNTPESSGYSGCKAQSTRPYVPPRIKGTQMGYVYNPWSYFSTISSVLRVTNDSNFLNTPRETFAGTMSLSELLEVIATTPRHFYLPGTNLSSYSLSASQYLEAVPSCESLRATLTVASDTKTNTIIIPAPESDGDVLATHLALADVGATAAQSATNVWMMRVVADLRASQADVAAAAALRSAADSLLDELVARLFVPSKPSGTGTTGGYFGCLYENASSGLVETRSILDYFYVGMCGCGWPADTCGLPRTVQVDMQAFARRELKTRDWMRAFSPHDPLRYVGRPDQGTTGAFSSWPAYAAESTGAMGNWSGAVSMMSDFAHAAREGPWGQGREVWQEPAPSFAPHNDAFAFKTARGSIRYVEEGGGSFADVVLRAFFGFAPPIVWANGGSAQELLDAALWRPNEGRGFGGVLTGVRTPVGLATITSHAERGLTIALERAHSNGTQTGHG